MLNIPWQRHTPTVHYHSLAPLLIVTHSFFLDDIFLISILEFHFSIFHLFAVFFLQVQKVRMTLQTVNGIDLDGAKTSQASMLIEIK